MALVAYDPSDPTQANFLAALGIGETGSATGGYSLGVGGTDLSGDTSVDSYGFPTWSGSGNSHAAGEYQFQPSTWDNIASEYGLNFANPADQNAGAWYLAQSTYSAQNGGASLESALSAGDYSSIETSLSSIWPSVTGNGAAPGGLAATLQNASATSSQAAAGPGGFINSLTSAFKDPVGTAVSAVVGGSLVRIAIIAVGVIVLGIALWQLLSSTGAVPSPSETVKAAGKVAVEAAGA